MASEHVVVGRVALRKDKPKEIDPDIDGRLVASCMRCGAVRIGDFNQGEFVREHEHTS